MSLPGEILTRVNSVRKSAEAIVRIGKRAVTSMIKTEGFSKQLANNFELLGHGFVPTYKKGERGKYQLIVKKGGWESLKRKLKAATKKTMPYSFRERLQKLKEIWMGWVNNYRLASIHHKLKQLDEWLRNRLRYCIWSR